MGKLIKYEQDFGRKGGKTHMKRLFINSMMMPGTVFGRFKI